MSAFPGIQPLQPRPERGPRENDFRSLHNGEGPKMEYREIIIVVLIPKSLGPTWAQKSTSWVFCKNEISEKLFEKNWPKTFAFFWVLLQNPRAWLSTRGRYPSHFGPKSAPKWSVFEKNENHFFQKVLWRDAARRGGTSFFGKVQKPRIFFPA